MAWFYNDLEQLEAIQTPSKASVKPLGATDMTRSCIPKPATEYNFLGFPSEIRNMIYHHLLKASYAGVGWYLSQRWSPLPLNLRIAECEYRPEAERLSILRVSRQISNEAICILYRDNLFCFDVQSPYAVAPGGLGAEALTLIQLVDIRVDTKAFMHPSGGMEEEERFVGQLRGLGGSKVPRKRCRVTLDCWGTSMDLSPTHVISGLKTLTNFELVILDATLFLKFDRRERYWAPSTWTYFDTCARKLKTGLGTGESDVHEGHYCLVFYPMERRIIDERTYTQERMVGSGRNFPRKAGRASTI